MNRSDVEVASSPDGVVQEAASVSSGDYKAVVEVAQIVDVLMVASRFQLDAAYFEARGNPRLGFHFSLDEAQVSSDEESGAAQARFTWSVKATFGEKQVLHTSATYVVMYTHLEGHKAEVVEAFIRRVGPFTTYPYFRAYVSQLSWMSKTELPILPIITEDSLSRPLSDPKRSEAPDL